MLLLLATQAIKLIKNEKDIVMNPRRVSQPPRPQVTLAFMPLDKAKASINPTLHSFQMEKELIPNTAEMAEARVAPIPTSIGTDFLPAAAAELRINVTAARMVAMMIKEMEVEPRSSQDWQTSAVQLDHFSNLAS